MEATLQQSEIITLKEACEILSISISHGYHIYHTWMSRGVRILKHTENAHPRFYRSDIIRMLESPK